MKTALVLAVAAVIFSSIPFFAHHGPVPSQAPTPSWTASPSATTRVLTADDPSVRLSSGTQMALNVATSPAR